MKADRKKRARTGNTGSSRTRNLKKVIFSEKQLGLPVGYRNQGARMTTLQEILDGQVPTTMSCGELTREQLVKLVSTRIQKQRKFQIAMVGIGVLDKTRAIAEVKAQSRPGRILMDIERRVIDRQLDRVRTLRQ